uniref:Alternative protein DENND1B n=1 Tax=Homo sapiens TaxID=9606 RepID=L8EC82_HUMAN|nr:alternative protein DENND1B [Homo sapiens]
MVLYMMMKMMMTLKEQASYLLKMVKKLLLISMRVMTLLKQE